MAKARASPMSLEDLDNAVVDLVQILSLVKADWHIKDEMLNKVVDLVGGHALKSLPEMVASRISDPEQI